MKVNFKFTQLEWAQYNNVFALSTRGQQERQRKKQILDFCSNAKLKHFLLEVCMTQFFGSKKITMEFTPEEYEFIKKEAQKQGITTDELLKQHFKGKAGGRDLDSYKFKLAQE